LLASWSGMEGLKERRRHTFFPEVILFYFCDFISDDVVYNRKLTCVKYIGYQRDYILALLLLLNRECHVILCGPATVLPVHHLPFSSCAALTA
jgi:hypothetical protein